MVIGEEERIGADPHYVAWTSDDVVALKKAGNEILHRAAFSHDHDLVAVADSLVGRAVKRLEKGIFKDIGRVVTEVIKAQG